MLTTNADLPSCLQKKAAVLDSEDEDDIYTKPVKVPVKAKPAPKKAVRLSPPSRSPCSDDFPQAAKAVIDISDSDDEPVVKKKVVAAKPKAAPVSLVDLTRDSATKLPALQKKAAARRKSVSDDDDEDDDDEIIASAPAPGPRTARSAALKKSTYVAQLDSDEELPEEEDDDESEGFEEDEEDD